jgi:hypothetical protein
MVSYRCEWCKREWRSGERWILALAAERITRSECRREIKVLRHWHPVWARHKLAVHLCCTEHMEQYVGVMFGLTRKRTAQRERGRAVVQLETHLGQGQVQRIEAPIERRHRAITSSRPSRGRKPKFTKLDEIRAHGMGIALERTMRIHPK